MKSGILRIRDIMGQLVLTDLGRFNVKQSFICHPTISRNLFDIFRDWEVPMR